MSEYELSSSIPETHDPVGDFSCRISFCLLYSWKYFWNLLQMSILLTNLKNVVGIVYLCFKCLCSCNMLCFSDRNGLDIEWCCILFWKVTRAWNEIMKGLYQQKSHWNVSVVVLLLISICEFTGPGLKLFPAGHYNYFIINAIVYCCIV